MAEIKAGMDPKCWDEAKHASHKADGQRPLMAPCHSHYNREDLSASGGGADAAVRRLDLGS